MLAKIDMYNLRFLESSENVRNAIADTIGRRPSAEVSKEVAVCIQQGRMFFESASNAAVEIRPLLLYYGAMAFAKSIICGRGLRRLATLNQKHGLSDVSAQTARLSELTVKIQNGGTFQEFNDVIREQEGLTFFEKWMTQRHLLPTTISHQLNNCQITLKDVLARTPGLEGLFFATFKEKAGLLSFVLHTYGRPAERVDLRIDLSDIFEDCHSLRKIVEEIREKFPTLQRWRFSSAEKAWDKSIIIFENLAPMENELVSENLIVEQEGRRVSVKPMVGGTYIDFRQLLNPLSGGLTETYPSLAAPINDAHISNILLQYAGMFLLSSLVRYRPQIWVHSISRFANHEKPADDQALALIEEFMNTVQSTYPKLVVRILTQA